MSTRNSTQTKSYKGYREWSSNDNPASIVETKNLVTEARTRIGYANPNWKEQCRNDINAATNFGANEQVVDATPFYGVIKVTSRTGLPTFHGITKEVRIHSGYIPGWNLPAVIGVSPAESSLIEADAIAIKNLHRKIKEVNHQFQGGTFAAQIMKSVRMVVSPAKALRESFSGYFKDLKKRTRGVKKKKIRQVIADTYLEYTFGWQPLLLDTKEAAIALARNAHERYQKSRFRVIGQHAGQPLMSSFLNGYYTDQATLPFYYLIDSRRISRSRVIYYGLFRGGVQNYDGTESPSGRLAALCGLDLQSFAPTVWECIPWSFAVDYFTNIGDIVDAYSYSTSSVRWLNKVVILSVEDTLSFIPQIEFTKWWSYGNYPDLYEVVVEGQKSTVSSAYKSMSRSRLEEVPFPTFRFELPMANSMKWVNLGALALGARSMSPFK